MRATIVSGAMSTNSGSPSMFRAVSRAASVMWFAFDPDSFGIAGQFGNSAPVVIALPVGVDDIVLDRAPPGLPSVDIGGYRGAGVLRDYAPVGAPERTVQKAGIVGDVVHRRQQYSRNVARSHDCAKGAEAAVVFTFAERQHGFLAVVAGKVFRAI